MSSKARSLRERMSIDPDAPTPVAARPPRRPVARPAPAADPAPTSTRDRADVPVPRTEVEVGETGDTPPPPASAPAPSAGPRKPPRRGGRAGRATVDWETAVDDPAITSGNGYRSFYVSDEVFARFRAAIYWTARRPDAEDVPDNMSAGIEDYMESVARDLERRFNQRGIFPPTPDQVRAHEKRGTRSTGTTTT